MGRRASKRGCVEIVKFDRRMRSIRYHLRAIEQDIQLASDGWQINYAVDFSEIYRYAFALHHLLSRSPERVCDEAARKELVDKSSAIRLLLTGTEIHDIRLVLLPAYALELSQFLESRSSVIRQKIQWERLKDLRNDNSSKGLDTSWIDDISSWLEDRPDEEMPRSLIKRGVEFFSTEFSDLLFVWLAVVEQGVEALRPLLDSEPQTLWTLDRLPKYDEQWVEPVRHLGDVNTQRVQDSKWLSMFQHVRRRWASDWIDAQALETVFLLNSYLVDNRQVVLIFSDAPAMSHVLNWNLVDRSPPDVKGMPTGVLPGVRSDSEPFLSDYHILRTPRTILTLLKCSGNSQEETLANIQKKREAVDSYFGVAAAYVKEVRGFEEIPAPDLEKEAVKQLARGCRFFDRWSGDIKKVEESECRKCPYMKVRGKLIDTIEEHEDLVNEFHNIELFRNKERFLGEIEESDLKALRSRLGEDLPNLLLKVAGLHSGKNTYLEKALEARQSDLRTQIDAVKLEVTRGMVGLSTGLRGYRFDKYVRIFQRVQFRHSAITKAVCSLEQVGYGPSARSQDMNDALTQLWELSTRPASELPEARLLQAALAYACGEVETCVDILKRQRRQGLSHNVFGFRYLESLATNTKGLFAGDRAAVDLSVQEAHNLVCDCQEKPDPRAYHLYGLVCSRALDHFPDYDVTLDAILESFDKALRLNPYEDLRLVIINNMLYAIFLFDRDNTVAIQRGQSLLRQMESIESPESWPPSHLDTAGCIHLRLASADEANRIDHLQKAIPFFQICLKKSMDWLSPRSKQSLYQEHLKSAETQLAALKTEIEKADGQESGSCK